MFGKYLNQYPFGRGLYVPPGWAQWQAAYSDGPQWQMYPAVPLEAQRQRRLPLVPDGAGGLPGQRPRQSPEQLGDRPRPPAQTALLRDVHADGHALPVAGQPDPRRDAGQRPGDPEPQLQRSRRPTSRPTCVPSPRRTSRPWTDGDRRKEWEAAASIDDAIRRLGHRPAGNAVSLQQHGHDLHDRQRPYSFGEHRWQTKRCEFNECSRTPMLIRYPDAPRAARHHAPAVQRRHRGHDRRHSPAPPFLPRSGGTAGASRR